MLLIAGFIALIVLLISCRCHFWSVFHLSLLHGSTLNSWDTGHHRLMKKCKHISAEAPGFTQLCLGLKI